MKGIEFTDMDIEKLIVIQSVIDGKKTGKQASEKLNLSERQIWRLVAKVKKHIDKEKEKIIWVSWFKQMEHLSIGLKMVICIQFMALLMMQQDKY